MSVQRDAAAGNPSPAVTVDILVEADLWGDGGSMRPLFERAAAAVAASGEVDTPDGAELSVVLTDDERIRALNRDYRGKDKATNVLSFPVFEPGEEAGPMLGDIVIAYETARREALEEDKPFEHHVAHLLVHGLLHLYGYDHEEGEEEAEAMERLETAVLASLGIPDPYAGTEPVRPDGVPIETKTR